MNKKPKWQRGLTKAELKHLKEIDALTKKAFIYNNNYHNSVRNEAGAVEPCYACKGIALKLGLPVSKLKPQTEEELANKLRQAVTLVDDNKPKPKPWRVRWYPEGIDLPLIYWFIAASTIFHGIATALAYWLGWWN